MLAVAVAVRALWALLYGPVVQGDAVMYLRIAERIATGRLAEDDGGRPPFYPLFLLAGGMRPVVVQMLQSALGVATTWLVFALVWRGTGQAGIATVAGLIQAVSPDALAFEAYLVTEATATFLIALAAVLLIAAMRRPTVARLAALSLVLAIASLNKTFHLYLVPFDFAALLLVPPKEGPRWAVLRPGRLAAFAIPVLVLVGGWCTWEWRVHGVFTPSTMTGYRLTQHVGGEMELAPDRYAVLRDIYLAHRARARAAGGNHVNVIWSAIPDMQRATGLSYAALAKRVEEMSFAVVRADPACYLRSVARAWVWSWSRPTYLVPTAVRVPALRDVLYGTGRVARVAAIALNALFLLMSVSFLAPRARRLLGQPVWLPVLVALILTGVTVAAIGEYSDNGKFAAPFMPLVLVTVLTAVGRVVAHRGGGFRRS